MTQIPSTTPSRLPTGEPTFKCDFLTIKSSPGYLFKMKKDQTKSNRIWRSQTAVLENMKCALMKCKCSLIFKSQFCFCSGWQLMAHSDEGVIVFRKLTSTVTFGAMEDWDIVYPPDRSERRRFVIECSSSNFPTPSPTNQPIIKLVLRHCLNSLILFVL